jgi:hypothetical protein
MAINIPHFDTKLQAFTEINEQVLNSIAEYLFPDTEFALAQIYENSTTAQELQKYQNLTAQFSNGDKVYFASSSVRDKVYPNKSDGAAYGSLIFTPCKDFKELRNLRILVVDDATGENGGLIPFDQAKKLVGDCYGRMSPNLGKELTGSTNTPFQFRLGIKPQEGSEVHRIAKGTLAPAQELAGYDLVLATSSFKGRKDESKIEPGEHTLTVGIGIKTSAEYGKHSLGTQVLVNYPKGVEADILQKIEVAAQRLASIQSEPRKIAQYFIDKHERRLEVHSFNEEEPEEAKEQEQQYDQEFYSLLKTGVEGHPQLLEHPNIVSKLTQLIRKEWADIATGRAIEFMAGLAQPSLDLQKNEICVPHIPEGEKLIVTRSPLINSNGVITLTNKHLTEEANSQGTVHIHPETAAVYLQADFDGDRLAYERASLYPTLAAEIEAHNLPQNRHTDVIKADKEPYVADTFGEIALAASSNKIGMIANNIQRAVALRNEIDSLPEAEKTTFLSSLKTQCLKIATTNLGSLDVPEAKKEQCLSIQEEAKTFTRSPELQTAKRILFQTVDILSNELQTAADGPKSAARPNEDVLKFANTILDFREVAWISDKKQEDAYSNRTMRSENHSPIDKMIHIANQAWQEHHLESLPTNQFANFFPKDYTPAQEEAAKQIVKTYNNLYGQAVALKTQATKEPGPQLTVTSATSGKQIIITDLMKYNHPDVWQSNTLDIKLTQKGKNLIATAPLKNNPTQWEPLGKISSESASVHNLREGMTLFNAKTKLTLGITPEQIKSKFQEARDFASATKSQYKEQSNELQSAIWHTAHASKQKGYENYARASAAFNIFPELVAERAKDFQFTEITLAGIHQPTNEWGQQLNGKTVDFQVALETRENHPNFNKRVVMVEGKQVAPLSEQDYQLPIGTKGKATLTSPPGATLVATTAKGNTIKVTQLSKHDFAGHNFSTEQSTVTIGFITPSGKDNPVPVAKIGDKVLGVIDKSDRQKLQAAKLLRPGASIRCELQSNPATTAILCIDKESLRYPTTWIRQADASKQAWIQENLVGSREQEDSSPQPRSRSPEASFKPYEQGAGGKGAGFDVSAQRSTERSRRSPNGSRGNAPFPPLPCSEAKHGSQSPTPLSGLHSGGGKSPSVCPPAPPLPAPPLLYERPPWEQNLVKTTLKALNSVQPDAKGQRIGTVGQYIATYTDSEQGRTLKIVDANGKRGILYQAQAGSRPSVDNFSPIEKQQFQSLNNSSAVRSL